MQAWDFSTLNLQLLCRKVDAKISELLADRDLSRTWIHVDLDAFFASVEELDDPSLVLSYPSSDNTRAPY